MLRVVLVVVEAGELVTEGGNLDFCGDVDDAVDPMEVEFIAAEAICARLKDSFSLARTSSAIRTILLAMTSKTSVTLTMALLALQSVPVMASKAYVLFAPRERGS